MLKWKEELLKQQNKDEVTKNESISKAKNYEEEDIDSVHLQNEKKAEYLFNKGILLEQQGRLYEGM